MAWRKSGQYRPAEEILVMTCDICGRDIGFEDERRPDEYFRITRHPNAGSIGDQESPVTLCSCQCLRAFASQVRGPDRTASARGRGVGSCTPEPGR